MARARNIKPGMYKNEDLAECSIWARYIFPALWMLADREGRMEDRPKRIKAEILPFDSQDIEPLLVELEQRGFLVRYRNSDGSFIQISSFKKHQTPHYSEKASVIKGPELQDNSKKTEGLYNGQIPRGLQETSESDASIKRGSQHSDSLILRLSDSPNPDSLTADSLNPESLQKQKPSAAPKNGAPAKTAAVWSAYCQAYENRYQAAPIRNAKINGMLARFLERVSTDEAPDIAAFYVGHNGQNYVRRMHSVDMLLADAEKLRTEWVTGRRMTSVEAKGAEQGDAVRQQADRVGKLLGAGNEAA